MLFPEHSILIVGKLTSSLDVDLNSNYCVFYSSDISAESPLEDVELCNSISGVVVAFDACFPFGWLDYLPNLRVISSVGFGLGRFPVDECSRRGISLYDTSSAMTECVADYALGLILAESRSLFHADKYLRDGPITGISFMRTSRVSGKRLGIFGLGRVGCAIAERAAAFNMYISYHDLQPVQGVPWRYFESLMSMADWCDFLVISVPLTSGTKSIVDFEVLRRLGSSGVLVNISHSNIVVEAHLIRALQDGSLGGAALDVYDSTNPLPQALAAIDRVILSPRVAGITEESTESMLVLALENLRMGLET